MSSSSLHFGLHIHSDAGSRPATDDEIISIALLVLNKKLERVVSVSSPAEVKSYLSLRLGALPHEVFGVLFLDAQTRVIEFREMFRGTLTQTAVYPREVVKEALQLNAASVILSHNHPSGVAEPSRADEYLTKSLQDALKLVDVRVLDHIVIGGGQATSFAERGLL